MYCSHTSYTGAETHRSIEIPPPRHLAEFRSKQLDFTRYSANNHGSKRPRTTPRPAASTRQSTRNPNHRSRNLGHADQVSGSQASPTVPTAHGTMNTPTIRSEFPPKETTNQPMSEPSSRDPHWIQLDPKRYATAPREQKAPNQARNQHGHAPIWGATRARGGEGQRRGAGALPSLASSRGERGRGGGIRRGSEARRGKRRGGALAAAAVLPACRVISPAGTPRVLMWSPAFPPRSPVRCGAGARVGVGGCPAVVGWRDGRPRLVTRPRGVMSPVGRWAAGNVYSTVPRRSETSMCYLILARVHCNSTVQLRSAFILFFIPVSFFS